MGTSLNDQLRKYIADEIENIESGEQQLKRRFFGPHIDEDGNDTEPLTEIQYREKSREFAAQKTRAKGFLLFVHPFCPRCYIVDDLKSQLLPRDGLPSGDVYGCGVCPASFTVPI